MTVTIIICAILAVAIVAALITHFGWGISTQHRDHGVASTGSLPRRRIVSRGEARPHAGPVNPDAIPSESISGSPSDLSAGITDQQV